MVWWLRDINKNHMPELMIADVWWWSWYWCWWYCRCWWLYFDRELQFDYFFFTLGKPTCRKAQGLMQSVDDAKNSIQKATWESKERRWWTFLRKLPEELEELPWIVYQGWLDDLMGFNDSCCCCCCCCCPWIDVGKMERLQFLGGYFSYSSIGSSWHAGVISYWGIFEAQVSECSLKLLSATGSSKGTLRTTLMLKNLCISNCYITPRKINMEHNHGGLEDHFSF